METQTHETLYAPLAGVAPYPSAGNRVLLVVLKLKPAMPGTAGEWYQVRSFAARSTAAGVGSASKQILARSLADLREAVRGEVLNFQARGYHTETVWCISEYPEYSPANIHRVVEDVCSEKPLFIVNWKDRFTAMAAARQTLGHRWGFVFMRKGL